METIWVVGAGIAAYLLLGKKEIPTPAAVSPEEKAEEIADQVINQVDDIVDESGYHPPDEEPSGKVVNVLDLVQMVNESIEEYNANGDESIGSAEVGELDEVQKELFDSLSTQRNCIRIYDDQEIDSSTEAVYILLEQEKGWKVKHKPLQEGSTTLRKYFCPPGREPLQW